MPNTLVKKGGISAGRPDYQSTGGSSNGGVSNLPPVGSPCHASMISAIYQLVSPSMVQSVTTTKDLIVVRTFDSYILTITGAICSGGYVSLQYTWSSPTGVQSNI